MITARRLFTVALAAVALFAAGCSSNNKGKIEGKWKVTAPPDKDAKAAEGFKELGERGIYMYMEFKPDGTFYLGFGADNPGALAMLKMGMPGGKLEFPAKYRLKSGNKVEIYDLSADAKQLMSEKGDVMRSDVIIEGDNMTVKDPDGTITKLTRMKDGGAAPAAAEPPKT